jgi:methylthioribose-1-phosphate isomerase
MDILMSCWYNNYEKLYLLEAVMSIESVTHVDNVKLSEDGRAVVIIDQSLLPNETVYLTLDKAEDLWEAIYSLRVRGAPAIGIFAAYAIYVLSAQTKAECFEDFYAEFSKNRDYLDSSRPTAVNLHTMLWRMDAAVLANREKPVSEIVALLKSEAEAIHTEDMDMCRAISEYGLELVQDGFGILTHCNAGPLATSRYGTGLGTIFLGKERGMEFHAWVDETRPLLQGARLTSYELQKAGVDCTLICDNMASIVMKEGKVDACFVGCDRVAANGDTANKIGTSGVAILAKHYGIPFYVFCPSSTIDFNCKTGADIKIEERNPDEIKTKFFEKPMALPEVKCYNPAFDVTDAELITAIVTEKGICRAPYTESLAALFGDRK